MDSSAPSFPKNPRLSSRETSVFSQEEQVERFKRAMGFYDAPVPGISARVSVADEAKFGDLSGLKKTPGPKAPLGPKGLMLEAIRIKQEAKRASMLTQDSFEISTDKEKARLAQTFRPVSDDEANGACNKVEAEAERKTESKDQGQGEARRGLGKKIGKMFASKKHAK